MFNGSANQITACAFSILVEFYKQEIVALLSNDFFPNLQVSCRHIFKRGYHIIDPLPEVVHSLLGTVSVSI